MTRRRDPTRCVPPDPPHPHNLLWAKVRALLAGERGVYFIAESDAPDSAGARIRLTREPGRPTLRVVVMPADHDIAILRPDRRPPSKEPRK